MGEPSQLCLPEKGDGKTRAQLIDAITHAYAVDRQLAGNDLDTLLDHLVGKKLVVCQAS